MPAPVSDSILGTIYLDATAFLNSAGIYGCARPVAAYTNTQVISLLALASRQVDAFTLREFTPGTITENHTYSPNTRRIFPNQPPVMSLISYAIQLTPGAAPAPVTLTPVINGYGGGSDYGVSYGGVIYNRSENYLELDTLASIATLTPQLVSLGMLEPQVIIQYQSYQAVPAGVQGATGYIAAQIANNARLAGLLIPGLQSISELTQTFTRSTGPALPTIPLEAQLLLQRYVRPSIA